MDQTSKSSAAERRSSVGLYEWRESYTNLLEHSVEAVKSTQIDCYKFFSQANAAQSPFDYLFAWNELVLSRLSHLGQMVSESAANVIDSNALSPRKS